LKIYRERSFHFSHILFFLSFEKKYILKRSQKNRGGKIRECFVLLLHHQLHSRQTTLVITGYWYQLSVALSPHHFSSKPFLRSMAACTFSSKPFLRSLHFSRAPASFSRFSRRLSVVASATTATWTPAPLSLVAPATSESSIFHVVADLSSSPSLSTSYSAPGQYLQLRISGSDSKPAFMAIASPPTVEGRFEFLVKRVPGSTADLICGLKEGDLVELGPVMGKGFPIERIEGLAAVDAVFIFATGTGIRYYSFMLWLSCYST
jgi:hypothetical protein